MKIGFAKTGAVGFAGLIAAAAIAATAAAPASASATAKAKPTTSPAVTRVYVPSGEQTSCKKGYACTAVPYGKGHYVFKFYKYGRYSLRHWTGKGPALNKQTGGAAMRLYTKSGNQARCIPANKKVYNVNWNPIWSIRLTSSTC